ncbi:phage tail protein [Enterobacter hormaechei subsp. xiangfangensis]|nr:phage tail protein [Enterobacter hormaechei subsp. xiangfangensis]MCU2421539.1 phage tail protein [Enterobacter hormaechei subsp. xiangfangensis]MCU2844071.1 phage tail protein [Enterobacter hormaechei subsp. xiangfangensis]MCU2945040.1 phage tail protein [Enterobacter hormaechei subsp. xiangfangensis]MCU3082995.1 phage tail protein [Enterobacter hormaechei subsp. xiangfangensis]
MAQNVGDIEYVIKANTAELLRADKQVVSVTNNMESGFKKADSSAEKLNTTVTKTASAVSGGLKSGMQQAGYQIQDFIVQVQGGQSALVAFSQQGSQLAGAFGPGGAVVGAFIALGSVLVGTLSTALGSTKDEMEQLKTAAETLNKVVVINSQGVAALSNDYARLAATNATLAAQLRDNAIQQYEIAVRDAGKAITNIIDEQSSWWRSLNGGVASVKAFGGAMDTMEISADNFNDAIKQATSLGPSFNSATLTLVNTVAMLSSQFDISDDAAYGLGKRLNDLAKNPSPQSVSLLVDYMKSLKPTTQDGAEAITNLEKKILDAAAAMQQAHDNGESLRKTLDGLKTEAQQANFDGISKQLEAQRIALTKGKQAAIEYGIEQQDLTREQKDQLIALSRTNAQLAEEKEKRDKASKAGLKQAAATESVSLKLEQLRKRSELSGESTAELSREQAILTAQQSLGKAATKEQIALAGQYAAKTWDAANALKKRSQAEQARRFTDQEIATNKTTPDAITGAVADPTALINLQEQQKLAALAQYQQMGVLSAQQFEDTKTAIQEQASNARKRIAQDEANSQMAATVSMLNAASLGFDSLAGIISGAAGKASSAYIAMFAAAKSFAIASATLDFNGALLKALNAPDSLTTAQRFANYAAVASAGASVLSNIASVSMSGGRRYGGTVSAGNAYRINEDGRSEIFQTAGGQQAFIPNQSGKIIPADKAGVGGSFNPVMNLTINTTGGIGDDDIARLRKAWNTDMMKMMIDQQRPNGLLRRK